MLRMHQARLRFSPSRWTSSGSLRSVTAAGASRVFGSPRARSGQEPRSQSRNSAGGSTRRIRSASTRLGEKKSVPPGSQRGRRRRVLGEVGPAPLLDQLA